MAEADVERPAKETVALPMSAIAVTASFQLDGISYLRCKRDLEGSATFPLIQIKFLCPETPASPMLLDYSAVNFSI